MHGYVGIAILWLLVGSFLGFFINDWLRQWVLRHAPADIARSYLWRHANLFRAREDEPWKGAFRCEGKGCGAPLCGVCGSHFAAEASIEIDAPDQDHVDAEFMSATEAEAAEWLRLFKTADLPNVVARFRKRSAEELDADLAEYLERMAELANEEAERRSSVTT